METVLPRTLGNNFSNFSQKHIAREIYDGIIKKKKCIAAVSTTCSAHVWLQVQTCTECLTSLNLLYVEHFLSKSNLSPR